MAAREDRYSRLDEYMDVCYQLWDSWEPDAIAADKTTGVYADPAKVRVVDHDGEYYRCHARHFVAPSPQGRPVLWQAGSSDRDRDFSTYDPDEYVQNIEVPGIQGLFESIIYAKGGAPVTVREAAEIYAQGMGMPVLVGTPAEIADDIERFTDEGGADGFVLIATYTPGCFEEFVDLVVPEWQRRGRYRTEYSGITLRDHLLEDWTPFDDGGGAYRHGPRLDPVGGGRSWQRSHRHCAERGRPRRPRYSTSTRSALLLLGCTVLRVTNRARRARGGRLWR